MGLAETYNYYYHEIADPRVTNWPLMGDPWPIILIIASYLYFVFQYDPRFMQNRPAYELKTFIRFYNLFQVFANAYIVSEVLAVYPDATALRCDEGDDSWNPDAVRVARTFYYVILLKMVDLIETGLFVLRKKKNQISFLHHISTILFGVILGGYISGGMAVFYPALNSAVHVQFVFLLLHAFVSLKPSCHVTKLPAIFMIPNILLKLF
ncbi:elongation of very long chain fatty acids protein 1-like [Belonocnema kinseyi]|uniref:elongation of very long chain fatty acids protein 1-like n=1 Tax=Belonocnema kinseyi TaxID=2817044 RepID=UPI00143DA09E|nr:elongation of very long chain fatty acids protein 1-like [Belonocnema kinseyi]